MDVNDTHLDELKGIRAEMPSWAIGRGKADQ